MGKLDNFGVAAIDIWGIPEGRSTEVRAATQLINSSSNQNKADDNMRCLRQE